MFTGIIEEVGVVEEIDNRGSYARINISCKKILEDTKIGDSISVNGVCLTVTNIFKNGFYADVMPETYRRTSLSLLKKGDKVNLERAMKLDGRFGGHIVLGHVDGIGKIIRKEREHNAVVYTIRPPHELLKYIIFKGSVAVDGISLTVSELGENYFKVSIIPHTAENTTLIVKDAGDNVNIECDVIGKYVERLLNLNNNQKKDISMDFLEEHGFL